jgi:hypothetical protein
MSRKKTLFVDATRTSISIEQGRTCEIRHDEFNSFIGTGLEGNGSPLRDSIAFRLSNEPILETRPGRSGIRTHLGVFNDSKTGSDLTWEDRHLDSDHGR